MKLTKLQRYTLYCILLEEAEKDYPYYIGEFPVGSKENGFCWMYNCITNSGELYYDFHLMLPELYEKRTVKLSNRYYFNSWDERIKALKQCIEETHP